MTRNILFLCTGNSARSIMAEAYMNKTGNPAWRAWSAGSKPTGSPNPFALETLQKHDIPAKGGDGVPRSKSWDEFATPDAPIMDVVVTVCDNAAHETCPVWPKREGNALQRLHWSFPDPAAATGSDTAQREQFNAVFEDIKSRIDAFLEAETKTSS